MNWRYLDHPPTPTYLILLNFPASRLLAPSIPHYLPTYLRPQVNERAERHVKVLRMFSLCRVSIGYYH